MQPLHLFIQKNKYICSFIYLHVISLSVYMQVLGYIYISNVLHTTTQGEGCICAAYIIN